MCSCIMSEKTMYTHTLIKKCSAKKMLTITGAFSKLLSFCASCITDHWSQITITNIIIMKKFEISQEFPKCDPQTRSGWMLLEKWHQSTSQHRVDSNFQFEKKKKKNAMFMKNSKAKHSKMKYVCTLIHLILPVIKFSSFYWWGNWSPGN